MENVPQIIFLKKRHYINFQRKSIILFTFVINRVINVINANFITAKLLVAVENDIVGQWGEILLKSITKHEKMS